MPLAMSRPWKHPKTGIYQLRKAVPDDLRKLVGKREEKVSLRTRDPGEAKVRHAKAFAELEARWANLRAGPKALTECDAHQLAIVAHDRWLEQHKDNPTQQTSWDIELGGRLFGVPKTLKEITAEAERLADFSVLETPESKILRMEQACLDAANDYLTANGIFVDHQNRRTMARALGVAVQRASVTLARLARGESIQDFPFSYTAVSPRVGNASAPQRAVTFQDLLNGWAAERRPVAKTVYEWSRVFRELEKYLGHTDALRLTPEKLIDWKGVMVSAGLRAKTIQGSKLSPVRAILQWGVQNKLLESNAAEGISLDVKAKQGERKRSFTDEEAKIILRAARFEKDSVKRWVPWIGAYTGARLSEICQLRCEDVLKIDEVWCIKFAPEAGSLKTSGSERVVPVHPALIDSGLLNYVSKVRSGPLFAELSPDKFGKRAAMAQR
ncbi:DUF6538 domain-containing protein [Bradyrhizobium sp. 1050_B9_N1_2]|uniref:DUF6538 domain-containing protein n=1 Tax=Bradyrhizobium sp. 1050_B9_N1_2 TaxID=3238688 RepID=UPI003EDBF3EA